MAKKKRDKAETIARPAAVAAYPWQQQRFEHLARLVKYDKLPHALLFAGAAGLGKRNFAGLLAGLLLCQRPLESARCGECKTCLLVNSGTHPDLLYIEPVV